MATDPAREWWQQPTYIDVESPRMYVDLVAPDPAPPPVVEVTVIDVAPAQIEYRVGSRPWSF